MNFSVYKNVYQQHKWFVQIKRYPQITTDVNEKIILTYYFWFLHRNSILLANNIFLCLLYRRICLLSNVTPLKILSHWLVIICLGLSPICLSIYITIYKYITKWEIWLGINLLFYFFHFYLKFDSVSLYVHHLLNLALYEYRKCNLYKRKHL